MHSSVWFKHDEFPTHNSIDVHLHLNAVYGRQWSRAGDWPAPSSDLTCLIYFLWSYIKSLVCVRTVRAHCSIASAGG
ncbi:hypothetical protein TNIN_349061 [Trichonephila inaurata madagascariensis]|uniref:Uncharacterized protein n=1 Tax=Trichonephila inaurata madagascariensis TaxID=2747483 RepID=A0A8X6Y0L3_9ARAC|nr:hypothetical protein TNIN_349061 [Trichonephila inaurata madagascariensis]